MIMLVSLLLILGSFPPGIARDVKSSEAPGRFVIRTGVNVSHWLSQSQKRGDERRNYIRKMDFDSIASMGFDHVRIPLDEVQMWDSVGKKEPEAFELLHDAMRWALTAHLRVIVDLHVIRSHHFNATSNTLWTDPAEQDHLVGMWRQLSDEMHQYPNDALAYEILNEAVANDPEDWNNVMNKTLAAIRVKEPERIIVVGSNRWQSAETFPRLRFPEHDPNLILSFHFYTPMALTHHTAPWTSLRDYVGPVNYPGQIVDTASYKDMSASTASAMRDGANGYFTKDSLEARILPAIRVAKAHQLQLYCGEYGVYPAIPDGPAHRYYSDLCDIFRRNGIAYCHWCYKGDFPVVNSDGTAKARLVSILTAK